MRLPIIPLGDRAILVDFGDRIAPEVNDQVIALFERLVELANDAIEFCVPAFCSLGIGYDPVAICYADLCLLVQQQFDLIQSRVGERERPKVRIPVCYSPTLGFDLEHVSETTGLSRQQIIELHTSKTYRAYMLGFLPGFAYLGSVDAALRVDRRHEPRLKVAAGSVGIVGEQTGVYPCDAPGGWQIIGRTPISTVRQSDASDAHDHSDKNQFLIAPGDEVEFYPIDQAEFDSILEKSLAVNQPTAASTTQVNDDSTSLNFKMAGLRAVVQDFGRTGCQHLGIPIGGVMDRFSATIANRLVGNTDHATLIEIALLGPAIEFSGDCQIAITGADLSPKLDGHSVSMWETVSVVGQQRLSFGARQVGCRCYLAIAGDFEPPQRLGSSSPSATGAPMADDGWLLGGSLLKGQTVTVSRNRPSVSHKRIFPVELRPACLVGDCQQASGNPVEHLISISKGPEWDWFSDRQRSAFFEHRFEVLANSNSMGFRLSSFLDQDCELPSMISSAVVPGVIQVTPSSQCILLMRDAQTTGGYPRIGVVDYEALNDVAQLCPGDRIRFQQNGL